jgi:lantibiotic modifying enzyme
MKPLHRRAWRALLAGAQRDEACAVIEEIAKALDVAPEALASPTLNSGASGRAIFFAYLGEAWSDHGHGERAARHLEYAIDELASYPLSEALYSGFTGVGWTFEHLQGRFVGPDDDDPNLSLDETLSAALCNSPWTGDFDLIRGLAGAGLYALERLPRPIAAQNLTQVVERLAELAVERDGGITWLSRPELMIPETRSLHPRGYYNLGVAHGVPGAIAVLAGAYRAGVAPGLARSLLEGAWRWMMAHRREPHADTTFRYWVRDDAESPPSRSAWCYGDPGTAAALYWAARTVENTEWIDQALEIARRAVARPVEHCGCVDAGLCHGASGLLHIYNRLWQATGEPHFADAARQWCTETFKLRRHGRGIAGFQTFVPVAPGKTEPAWLDDPSFLTGAAGIALALLAAVSTVEPAWDRVLLASLPPAT